MRIPGSVLFLSLSKLEVSLIALALLSLAVLLVPSNKVAFQLELDPASFPARLVSDQNGVANVSWVDEEQRIWRCESDRAFGSAFCSYILILENNEFQGIDLSKFSRISLQADYVGNGDSLRIYLRNRHPAYFREDNEISTKYNLIEIPVSFLLKGEMIEMESFVVADWWLDNQKLALEQSQPEFGDVIFLEIQSGSFREAGSDQIKLNRIHLEGNYINDELLYRVLSLLWVGVIFGFLVIRFFQLKRKAKVSFEYQQELRSIHKILNLKNKQFEDLAKKDPLTGALNRVGMRDYFQRALQEWHEKRRPFSLIFFDLDHFKRINDNFGHDVGDTALTSVTELIDFQLPQHCALARWGGEEFLIACMGMRASESEKLAQQLCVTLARTPFKGDLRVTASFGVAELNERGLSQLIKKADDAVYQAKANGRNQVCCRETAELETV